MRTDTGRDDGSPGRESERTRDGSNETVTGRRGFIALAATVGGGASVVGAASAQRLTGDDVRFRGCQAARVYGLGERDVTAYVTNDQRTGDGDDKEFTLTPCPPGKRCDANYPPPVSVSYDSRGDYATVESNGQWILYRVSVPSVGVTKRQTIRRCDAGTTPLRIRFLGCQRARVVGLGDRDVKVSVTRDPWTGNWDDQTFTLSPCPPGKYCDRKLRPPVSFSYDSDSGNATITANDDWRIYEVSVPDAGATETQNPTRC